ncbi:anaerobic ribonucleoside-triphosphate reductase activating protein [Sporobacter termitidis DSM 10068]|uniref:Anaerobic ribonucleoside-triphosphate reductase-activating protein n=1 Tax=Sporobacter termitidis DSM 10068 TaxID=1123282 RepID=A0A1M5YYF0_9FIRM|nr:anaerobic ribonucleoside-triphosphate reductase activating protein [Sporobacter termitidis]SHI16894.1 anaerobic ribonucleoside-triphosphate reductase activating protein [Sporobacter termitidis DSM 10068]
MRIAGLVQDSIVDGPGLRFAVFTQGCPHHCEGCHNPETHDPSGGSETPVADVIRQLLGNPLTDGVTLTGGEPFAQPGACAEIAGAARNAGLNVWAYSGYTFEELLASADPDIRRLLERVDVLVDGRFVLKERSLNLHWRGSRNQRIVDVPKSLAAGNAVIIE